MLRQFWYKLTGRQSDGFKPSRSDKELMENVRARLAMFGGTQMAPGSEIRSIPGAIVKFLPMAGMIAPTVYTDDGRHVGSITPNGEFVYLQPWKR